MIRGSLVPNITLFDESGVLDLRSTAWHIDWMFGHGVDGLFLTGSYGAGPLMSVEERIEVYRLAKSLADESGDHRTLIAHVGCIDTASTLRLAHAAEEVGVDAIGAVPPFYYKYSEDLVIDYSPSWSRQRVCRCSRTTIRRRRGSRSRSARFAGFSTPGWRE
jgi:dihydrodipicolinate synthase/N-acetylneuraminate lyase